MSEGPNTLIERIFTAIVHYDAFRRGDAWREEPPRGRLASIILALTTA